MIPELPWSTAGRGLQTAALAGYAIAQLLLALLATHRGITLWRFRRRLARAATPAPSVWPRVTVQLPLYNEPAVATRLIEAVACLDHPRDRLEVQVLDDSTDVTTDLVAAAVRDHRRRGLDIRHVRRPARVGFKAGALAAGLASASGEFVAVFDADFVPDSDFLRRTLPRFSDPSVGMVQGRWGHLNRGRSLLTAAQAVLLDSHFFIEHDVRRSRGLFFNFNGTAGVWRRACIEAAGGWSSDTLTEDLDLSYRAQLAGWRFEFDPAAEVPAELPSDFGAFRSQQRRWAKGSIQTARKILPGLLRRPLPWRTKLESLAHLGANLAYPLLLALVLLLAPVLFAPSTLSPLAVAMLQLGLFATGLLPVAAFLAAGQACARRPWPLVVRDVLGALALGIGMSANNARAVLEGFGASLGDWERTPKSGEGAGAPASAPRAAAPARRAFSGRTELALAVYSAAMLAGAVATGRWNATPFLALVVAGFAWVGAGTLRHSRRASLAPRS